MFRSLTFNKNYNIQIHTKRVQIFSNYHLEYSQQQTMMRSTLNQLKLDREMLNTKMSDVDHKKKSKNFKCINHNKKVAPPI